MLTTDSDSGSSLNVPTSVLPSAHPVETLSPKEAFARRWKFDSFLEMFEASTPEGNAGGKKKWLVTALRGGKCLLWNDAEIEEAQVCDSRQEAIHMIGLG
ncbi:MAG: hypothetical protein ACKVP0_05285 [Pirellulaceae bacterium]